MKSLTTPLVLFFLFAACSTGKKSTSEPTLSALQGSWQLNYISVPRIAFEDLYPDRKPILTFDEKRKKTTGNTSCNSFSGPLNAEGKKINFAGPLVMTKMACPGEGETVFLENLKKITRFDVTAGYTLTLLMGDTAIMRFTKVN